AACFGEARHEALTQKTRVTHATVYAMLACPTCNTPRSWQQRRAASLDLRDSHESPGGSVAARQGKATVSHRLVTNSSRLRICRPARVCCATAPPMPDAAGPGEGGTRPDGTWYRAHRYPPRGTRKLRRQGAGPAGLDPAAVARRGA